MKLVIEEAHSGDLREHLEPAPTVVTSRLALIEVPRATVIASPSTDTARDAARLLAACVLVDVGRSVIDHASALATHAVRTLDAIHLATALYVEADELVAYDRRLLAAAAAQDLHAAAPGLS